MSPPNVARTARRGERLAGRALDDRWVERVARAGLLSRAVNYIVLALLVALVVLGRANPEVDRRGAMETLAQAPLGRVLLVLLCLGFVAYIAWQLLRAAVHRREQDTAANSGRRLLALGTAAIYASLLVTTATALFGGSSSSPDREQESWTARLLGSGLGRIAVGLAAATLIISGLVLIGYAVSRRFEQLLEMRRMTRGMRRAAAVLGLVGQGARGAIVALVGGFVLAAALSDDPGKSKGLDATLKSLGGAPLGTALLGGVALGLLAFGLYSLIDARHRNDFSR